MDCRERNEEGETMEEGVRNILGDERDCRWRTYYELLISHFHIDLLSFSAILLGIDLLRGAFQGPYVCFVGSTCMLCLGFIFWYHYFSLVNMR